MDIVAQMAANHRLLGCKGCGSAIVECAFALAGIPLDHEEVDYSAGSPTRDRLLLRLVELSPPVIVISS